VAPPARTITSRRHPIVQTCRRVASNREPGDPILIDGAHLLDEALRAHVRIAHVLARDPHDPVVRRAQDAGAEIYHASSDALAAASPVRTSSGIVSLAEWAPSSLDQTLAAASGADAVVLALVDVQDPGNVGAAIRSADALGASGVVALGQTADPAGWRALRGAMGSTFRLPVARTDLGAFRSAVRIQHVRVVATAAAGGDALDAVALDGPIAFLLGNEGAGLSDDALALADVRVRVPMRAGVDSLNVSVTAALLLYERRGRKAPAAHR
jgi:TrmH family RNA methyltransferase